MSLQLPPFVFEDVPLKDDEVAAVNAPAQTFPRPQLANLSPGAAAALEAAQERKAERDTAAGDGTDTDYINARAGAMLGAAVSSAGVLDAYLKVDAALQRAHQARMIAARTKDELDDAEARAVRDGVAASLVANAKAAQGAAGKSNAEERAAALADHLRPWVTQYRDAARMAAAADLGLDRARTYARALEFCITIETNRK